MQISNGKAVETGKQLPVQELLLHTIYLVAKPYCLASSLIQFPNSLQLFRQYILECTPSLKSRILVEFFQEKQKNPRWPWGMKPNNWQVAWKYLVSVLLRRPPVFPAGSSHPGAALGGDRLRGPPPVRGGRHLRQPRTWDYACRWSRSWTSASWSCRWVPLHPAILVNLTSSRVIHRQLQGQRKKQRKN